MGFWDKIGGAAKWITDPKQLLTAAGFTIGGPLGAGVGRAVGGLVPQSAGPVPWGALGADTSEFRKSTLADGLQWRDLASAGKDFASGYGAGTVARQIPGLKNLEGAFRQGGMFRGAAEAGQGMGADALMKNNPGFMQVPDFQQVAGGAPPGGFASASGAPQAQSWQTQNFLRGTAEARPGMGAEALMRNNPDFPSVTPLAQTAEEVLEKSLFQRSIDQGKERAGDFWGGLSGMEKIYAVNAAANAAAGAAAGPHQIGEEGLTLLGDMGLFSPTQQRRTTNRDEWRSRRNERRSQRNGG